MISVFYDLLFNDSICSILKRQHFNDMMIIFVWYERVNSSGCMIEVGCGERVGYGAVSDVNGNQSS